MGREAKAKAARKRTRLMNRTPPKYVATGKLTREQRQQFQKERDLALVDLKRKFEAAVAGVQTAYWQRVEAADQA